MYQFIRRTAFVMSLAAACAGLMSVAAGTGPAAAPAPVRSAPAQVQVKLLAASAVTIQNFAFSPSTVSVRAGTTVTWTNRDQMAHNVVASGGAFSSPLLGNGQSFSFTFPTPGSYPYSCTIHPSMTGTVVVTP